MMKFIGLTASILFACGSAHAQSYPTRPITMVVPFAAGGATDVIARIVAEGMSEDLGQSIVIENVAGAGGTTGSARVMRADPDGYTLLTGHMGTHASAYSLYTKPKYDPPHRLPADRVGRLGADRHLRPEGSPGKQPQGIHGLPQGQWRRREGRAFGRLDRMPT